MGILLSHVYLRKITIGYYTMWFCILSWKCLKKQGTLFEREWRYTLIKRIRMKKVLGTLWNSETGWRRMAQPLQYYVLIKEKWVHPKFNLFIGFIEVRWYRVHLPNFPHNDPLRYVELKENNETKPPNFSFCCIGWLIG